MAKQAALVRHHLEWIPREAIEDYQDILRQHVKGRHGVYALYRGEELYYVGLASNLSTRLKRHLKDRHGESWDRFSIFLTMSDSHMKELESLVLRMVEPSGNKQRGRFVKSEDLLPRLELDFLEYQRLERTRLFGGRPGIPQRRPRRATAGRDGTGRKFAKSVSASDYKRCAKIVSVKLSAPLDRIKGTLYGNAEKQVGVYIMVSKTHGEDRKRRRYWFGLTPHQLDSLATYKRGYFAFDCGPGRAVLLIPITAMKKMKRSFHVTKTKTSTHWHVRVFETEKGFMLVTRKGYDSISAGKYLLSNAK